MPTAILPLETTSASLTITLASLASSTAGVGRVSAQVDNSTNRHQRIFLYAKLKLGTSPAAGIATLYLVRGDGLGNIDDGAGTADAGATILNATPVMTLTTRSSPATGDVLQGSALVEDPGVRWSIAVAHNTGVALDATAGNHLVNWIGEVPQVQN